MLHSNPNEINNEKILFIILVEYCMLELRIAARKGKNMGKERTLEKSIIAGKKEQSRKIRETVRRGT